MNNKIEYVIQYKSVYTSAEDWKDWAATDDLEASINMAKKSSISINPIVRVISRITNEEEIWSSKHE